MVKPFPPSNDPLAWKFKEGDRFYVTETLAVTQTLRLEGNQTRHQLELVERLHGSEPGRASRHVRPPPAAFGRALTWRLVGHRGNSRKRRLRSIIARQASAAPPPLLRRSTLARSPCRSDRSLAAGSRCGVRCLSSR